jgi:DNA-binding transcriptional LysR family regulator
MTLEQLAVFVAVAEHQHVTRAAEALALTPSAVSASIKALERAHNVMLFARVGRGIELTEAGRLFFDEARATLARAHAAQLALNELGGLKRGVLRISASQTTASHFLPPRLMRFHELYPAIDIQLTVGNTSTVAQDVLNGAAEIGLIEGDIDEPALAKRQVATDELVLVCAPDHPLATTPAEGIPRLLEHTLWIMREKGSGTRTAIEHSLSQRHVDPSLLAAALTMPSNESVLSALIGSACVAGMSKAAAGPHLALGRLAQVDIALEPRAFLMLNHKERGLSAAGRELARLCLLQPEDARDA